MNRFVRLTYVWHDCFLVETENCSLLFDFWKDPFAEESNFPLFLKHINRQKPLYVFVSHHHKDHFSKKIFEWSNEFNRIMYIISQDVERSVKYVFRESSLYNGTKISPDKYIVLGRGGIYNDNVIDVHAFGSTDIGNSYFIDIQGLKFFHAGDLNAWIWKDESTEEEVERALAEYSSILSEIISVTRNFDIVMFPVDSRIGTDYWTGASIFTRTFDVKHFFPMHFTLGENKKEILQREKDASDFEAYANRERGEYIALLKPYSVFQKSF